MMQRVEILLKEGVEVLENISDSPQLDSEIILAHLLNISRFDLLLNFKKEVDATLANEFAELIKRRADFEPVAYITNEKPFFEDVFYVDKRVLIPRPETEFLVLKGLELLQNCKEKPKVLDLCCGSGCAGLSILRVVDCNLTLSDVSEDALEVAKINGKKLFPQNREIKFIQSNLFENIKEKYDLIVVNPPYLSSEDMKKFVVSELEKEPQIAFFGGENGFELSEKILNSASNYLKNDRFIAIELGYEGSKHTKQSYNGLNLQEFIKDYSGIERVAFFSKR